MSLLGTYMQISGPAYALGAKLCTLSIAATSANHTQFERTWCDSTNTTIAQESWRVPTSAARGWFDGQRVSSRLWAYLDPGGTVESIASDLTTLAALNPTAPYLLAVHVREWSTVGRVAEVLAKLPSNFSLLPVHDWIPIADTNPTFRALRYA